MARAIVIAVALALAACSATGARRGADGNNAPSVADLSAGDSLGARELTVYLDLMRGLIEGDSLMQAETFRAVSEAADFAPTTTNRLKFALALAVPGHTGSNAALAERRLSALLSNAYALLPEERVLATIHLRDVEQRLILDAAAEQLRREAADALEQQNTESAERLEAALEENRRLRLELDDATQKLQALSTIEQSIRERENGPD